MSMDLQLLILLVALTLVQAVVAVIGAQMQVGLPVLVGNREKMPEILGWAGRAQRAHRNMLGSLVLFGALVLAGQGAGKANAPRARRPAVLLGPPRLRIGLHRRHPVAPDRGLGGLGGRPGDDLPAAALRRP